MLYCARRPTRGTPRGRRMRKPKTQPSPPVDPCVGIAYNAAECEKALRLADFAEGEGQLGLADGLRKLARHHADAAWSWVAAVIRDRAARAVDIAHPAAPPDVRSDLIEAALAGGAQ